MTNQERLQELATALATAENMITGRGIPHEIGRRVSRHTRDRVGTLGAGRSGNIQMPEGSQKASR